MVRHTPISMKDIEEAVQACCPPIQQAETVQVEPESWHRATMEVVWTDSGKLFLRHSIEGGGRISYPATVSLEVARQMWKYWQRACEAKAEPLNPQEPPPSA